MYVGIDLGTTNSALAYIDPQEAAEADSPPIRILHIPQAVAAGEVESRTTLPSFLYLGDPPSATEGFVGAHARDQGALTPTRLVHSAKSWLSNPEVDRTAKILPWDSAETGRVLSPVEVSARYLAQLRQAWDQARGRPLAEQDIVLTVPASFDEEARELTVLAAREAGLERLTLIEEPAAAFYSWIANQLAQSRAKLFDGQKVLVVDVGGGTSDFTLIRVARDGDRIEFTRTAVGQHLLLGGDNLDLTLAWLAETKLGFPLSARQRSSVRRQSTVAKERLLTEAGLEKVEITVLGAGASLVGGARQTEILRQEALELALEGFLPGCSLSDRPKQERRTLFRELGLPYVSDPAVTRHLAAFLESAGAEASGGPDAILFNGGFFIPEICRRRLADVAEGWYGRRPVILENHDLHLAVAVGAAYYCYVRATGRGLLVRGGLPRSYYIGIREAETAGARAVCLLPRGTEEGQTLELDLPDLQLLANRPVSFRMYSSRSRAGDAPGQLVEFAPQAPESEFHVHAPLDAVIRFGQRAGERLVPVKLGARLTEVGTLDIWCQSKISDHRWRLEFQLRRQAPAAAASPRRPAPVVSEEGVRRAVELLRAAFGAPAGEAAPAPEELPSRLEQALGLGKGSWPLSLIRQLADVQLELAEGRRRSAAWEARWLNVCGFCLRPGFGFPGDDLRIEQARRVYASGLEFDNQVQCQIEWWIFWGRVAGGLNRNQQVDLYQRLGGKLLPREKKRVRLNSSLLREMWRAVSGLELLPAQTRLDLGNALLARVQAGDFRESELWCLSRLGARELLYGPVNQVLAPAVAARWLEAVVGLSTAGEAVAALARQTGDLSRDLAPAAVDRARQALAARSDGARLLAILEGRESRDSMALSRIFGEELPSGLVFAAGNPGP